MEMNSASIHTQVLEDWTAQSWSDFAWVRSNVCPQGYDAVGVEWRGSKPYNITRYGTVSVKLRNDRYKTDYPSQPSRQQNYLYSGMKDLLCGKRSNLSYRDTPIIDIAKPGDV